ncbi:MAG: HmuY family protein [Bacteroidaceae bacterium]|nr:HmuY family protein [Bacteroidaceae bacterium]
MNKPTLYILLGIASFMGLFSACDVLEDVYDAPTTEKRDEQYYIDATDYAQWVYINLHTPTPTITTSTISLDDFTETGAPAEWDIAHHRYDVKTDGAAVMMTPYHSIQELETAGLPKEGKWVEDEDSEQCITVDMSHMMEGYLTYAPGHKNTELGQWVKVDTSNMPPNYTMNGNVMLLRLADGTYAAIQLANFMSTDSYQVKGWMTVNYKYPLFN